MRLSKHFTLEEMTKSMTAARKGIDNTPGSGEIHNLTEVCYNILEQLRAKFDKPVTICVSNVPILAIIILLLVRLSISFQEVRCHTFYHQKLALVFY